MPGEDTNNLIEAHREALVRYNQADEEVKVLLQGRKYKDLTEADRRLYQEVSVKRDNAYNEMRRLERALLDDIPGSQTGYYKPLDPEKLKKRKDGRPKADD